MIDEMIAALNFQLEELYHVECVADTETKHDIQKRVKAIHQQIAMLQGNESLPKNTGKYLTLY